MEDARGVILTWISAGHKGLWFQECCCGLSEHYCSIEQSTALPKAELSLWAGLKVDAEWVILIQD